MALPKRQQWRHSRQLVTLSFIIAAILCALSFVRLVSFPDCQQDEGISISTQNLQQPTLLTPPSSLSSQQSLGFFNDITDASWKIMQTRARGSFKYKDPNYPERGHHYPTLWYLDNLQPDFTCLHKDRVLRQGQASGPSYTCDPHRLRKQTDCLVYSFGSEVTYRWEDSLADLVGRRHCEIHVFGGNGNSPRPGDAESKNIHYHPWTLRSGYDTTYNAMIPPQNGVAASFPEIVRKLGHGNRTIDIFRLGCERCEWATYKDWISADIRQILIETHGLPAPDRGEDSKGNDFYHKALNASEFFDSFTANQFAMFSKETNVFSGGIGIDFGYVKLRPSFWGSNFRASIPARHEYLNMDFLKQLPLVATAPASSAKIPPLIIFVHRTNLIISQDEVDSLFNVENTITKVKNAIGDTNADTWLLDDLTCLAAIYKAKPELVHFYREENDKVRRDYLCRAAALYLSGGFYFDVDFELKTFEKPGDNVALVVARDGHGISHRFIAAEKNSSIMKLALDYSLDYYKMGQFDLDPIVEAIRVLKETVETAVLHLEALGGEPAVPWIAPVPSLGEHYYNPIPLDMRGEPSSGAKIPQRLIFISLDNVLESKTPTLLYQNVEHTIRMYREAWGNPIAPVWFLDDEQCRLAIYTAKPHLLPFYNRETLGAFKSDICRMAALYLTGGYYFDEDMQVIKAFTVDSNVKFATVETLDEKHFFQSFIASEREGRVLKKSLSEMLLFYETKRARTHVLLGPDTLKWSYDMVPPSVRGETVILKEAVFSVGAIVSQERRDGVGCCCQNGVQDPNSNEQLFYSHMVGGGASCMPGGSPRDHLSAGNSGMELERSPQKH